MPRYKTKSAEEIYKQQNTALHKAMAKLAGMPYREHKEEWLTIWSELFGRKVKGLSNLTLGERDLIIKRFQQMFSRRELWNPAVPKKLRDWQKGDKPAGYEMRVEKDKQVRFILALWAELGQEPHTIKAMIKNRYGVDDPRFLDDEQKAACINYLKARLKQVDRPARYYE